MKILQITNKVPFPPLEGGSIAMNMITQGLLKDGHSVKILTMNTSKYSVEIDMLPEAYRKATGIEIIFMDTRVKPLDALINLLFTKKSYHIERFISKEFEFKLIEILKNNTFDIIQLEMLFVTPYVDIIKKYSNAKIIFRAHNIEHFIWSRVADSCVNPIKKYYLNVLASRLKNFELLQIEKVDGIAAISATDVDFFKSFGCHVPMIDIPVAVEIKDIADYSVTPEFPGLFHLGSMNWLPNAEGIKWLLQNVWPKVYAAHSDISLSLAGRSFPEWLINRDFPGVEKIGEVANAELFMLSKQIMLVPLLAGSGMRVKIIEGMALGKTIISTTIGAEGIACEHRKNLLIADTPDEFVSAIELCINNKSLCKEIGENARTLIMNQYDNKVVTAKLVSFYNQIIHGHKN